MSPHRRGQNIGSSLIQEVIEYARKSDCYKLIATSRFQKESVHELYKNVGFMLRGYEFRINF